MCSSVGQSHTVPVWKSKRRAKVAITMSPALVVEWGQLTEMGCLGISVGDQPRGYAWHSKDSVGPEAYCVSSSWSVSMRKSCGKNLISNKHFGSKTLLLHNVLAPMSQNGLLLADEGWHIRFSSVMIWWPLIGRTTREGWDSTLTGGPICIV